MKSNSLFGCLAILFLSYAPMQAQSWSDWQNYSDYIFPEKAIFWFPKNVESFKIANTQVWSNNQWKDSTRSTNTYSVAGLIQTSKAESYLSGQWIADGTLVYTLNNTNGLTQVLAGLGTPPAFLPFLRFTRTLGTGNRLEKGLLEEVNQGTGAWDKNNLDSNVYAASGRQTHSYKFVYDAFINRWVIDQKDSLKYNAAGRLDTLFVDDLATGFPNAQDARWVYTYNAAGKITQIRQDFPKQVNGNLVTPFAWDSLVNALKITYAYNAQNQLTQLLFEGNHASHAWTPNVSKARYTFTVDAATGKALQELNDEYNSVTQTWTNISKTTYTYFRVGQEEILPTSALTISPNPIRDGSLHIALQEADQQIVSATLYDLYGRSVWSQKVDNQNSTDLNLVGIQEGTYFLKVQTNQGTATQKVLILK